MYLFTVRSLSFWLICTNATCRYKLLLVIQVFRELIGIPYSILLISLYFTFSRPKALDKIVSHQDIILVLRRFIQNGEVGSSMGCKTWKIYIYYTYLYLIRNYLNVYHCCTSSFPIYCFMVLLGLAKLRPYSLLQKKYSGSYLNFY